MWVGGAGCGWGRPEAPTELSHKHMRFQRVSADGASVGHAACPRPHPDGGKKDAECGSMGRGAADARRRVAAPTGREKPRPTLRGEVARAAAAPAFALDAVTGVGGGKDEGEHSRAPPKERLPAVPTSARRTGGAAEAETAPTSCPHIRPPVRWQPPSPSVGLNHAGIVAPQGGRHCAPSSRMVRTHPWGVPRTGQCPSRQCSRHRRLIRSAGSISLTPIPRGQGYPTPPNRLVPGTDVVPCTNRWGVVGPALRILPIFLPYVGRAWPAAVPAREACVQRLGG